MDSAGSVLRQYVIVIEEYPAFRDHQQQVPVVLTILSVMHLQFAMKRTIVSADGRIKGFGM